MPEIPQPTLNSCGPPSNWVFYTIQAGDTLSRLARQFNISITDLQRSNCLGDGTDIRVGQQLYVPKYSNPISPTSPVNLTLTIYPAWMTPSATIVNPSGYPTLEMTPIPWQSPTLVKIWDTTPGTTSWPVYTPSYNKTP